MGQEFARVKWINPIFGFISKINGPHVRQDRNDVTIFFPQGFRKVFAFFSGWSGTGAWCSFHVRIGNLTVYVCCEFFCSVRSVSLNPQSPYHLFLFAWWRIWNRKRGRKSEKSVSTSFILLWLRHVFVTTHLSVSLKRRQTYECTSVETRTPKNTKHFF